MHILELEAAIAAVVIVVVFGYLVSCVTDSIGTTQEVCRYCHRAFICRSSDAQAPFCYCSRTHEQLHIEQILACANTSRLP